MRKRDPRSESLQLDFEGLMLGVEGGALVLGGRELGLKGAESFWGGVYVRVLFVV